MVLSTYEKQRILFYDSEGLQPSQILSALKVEDIHTTRQTVARFLRRFQQTQTIARREGSGRPFKITARVRELVDRAKRDDDETTATQLCKLLTSLAESLSRCLPLSVAVQCQDGLSEDPSIVSYSDGKTKSSGLYGHVIIMKQLSTMALLMSSGRMKLQCN